MFGGGGWREAVFRCVASPLSCRRPLWRESEAFRGSRVRYAPSCCPHSVDLRTSCLLSTWVVLTSDNNAYLGCLIAGVEVNLLPLGSRVGLAACHIEVFVCLFWFNFMFMVDVVDNLNATSDLIVGWSMISSRVVDFYLLYSWFRPAKVYNMWVRGWVYAW